MIALLDRPKWRPQRIALWLSVNQLNAGSATLPTNDGGCGARPKFLNALRLIPFAINL